MRKCLEAHQGTIRSVARGRDRGWIVIDETGRSYRTFSYDVQLVARDYATREVPVVIHFHHGWLYRDVERIVPRFVEVPR